MSPHLAVVSNEAMAGVQGPECEDVLGTVRERLPVRSEVVTDARYRQQDGYGFHEVQSPGQRNSAHPGYPGDAPARVGQERFQCVLRESPHVGIVSPDRPGYRSRRNEHQFRSWLGNAMRLGEKSARVVEMFHDILEEEAAEAAVAKRKPHRHVDLRHSGLSAEGVQVSVGTDPACAEEVTLTAADVQYGVCALEEPSIVGGHGRLSVPSGASCCRIRHATDDSWRQGCPPPCRPPTWSRHDLECPPKLFVDQRPEASYLYPSILAVAM